jgi:hypothetical protein
MNRETDTVFLQTLGRFISAQVQLAAVPLLQKIETLETQVMTLREIISADNAKDQVQGLAKELDGAIEGFAAEITRVERLIPAMPEVVNGRDGAAGKDGADAVVDYDMINHAIKTKVEIEIEKFSVVDGKDGEPGKDADMDSLFAYIENYMKAIPLPQNGKDGKDGKDGLAGRDGADVVAAFRDSDRHLILTLSNGVVKDIGQVHGENGKDGINGRDGVAYDKIEFVQDTDDPRLVTVKHTGANGEHITWFRVPGFLDKGVWRAGKYLQGDSVSLGGSMFLARVDTEAKPEISTDWRLSVKRGDPGKTGAKGEPGDSGKHGRDGRDLTQIGPDGSKW